MRLVIISNRLPITVSRKGLDSPETGSPAGGFHFEESVGGLASGIKAFLSSRTTSNITETLWIGWPGLEVDESERGKLADSLLTRTKCYPVYLSEDLINRFYHGFSNKTIWPLFHYFPSFTVYDPDFWKAYQETNQLFCDMALPLLKDDDIVWVQDYHLMLLPRMLREKRENLKIGFFLHIPFPTFEVFRLLPKIWREEILAGVMGSDLVGFHTRDYTQYFLQCVLRLFGHDHQFGKISTPHRLIKAETYPMGIDFKAITDLARSEPIVEAKRKLKNELAAARQISERQAEDLSHPQKVILSVDRLDYTKGVVNRLKGYEIFLEQNPDWHKRVSFVLRVAASREKVDRYQQMKNQIDQTVGRINGHFGSIDWTPVSYQYRFLSMDELIPLYGACDVALITPLRDGMNLIAKEFLASRVDEEGTLVLSEFAGAAKEMAEALLINPNNYGEIADAIKEALTMPPEEQKRRNQIMQKRLKRYDIHRWGNHFVDDLLSFKKEQEQFQSRQLGFAQREGIVSSYTQSKRRLLFLDYDGTLIPFAPTPKKAVPTHEILSLLEILGTSPNTRVVLISGRDRASLEAWFGHLPIDIVAEHGIWLKEKGEEWKLAKALNNQWKASLMPILELFTDRLVGSFIEEKDYSLVFHYRQADSDAAREWVQEFQGELVSYTANIDVQILKGNKVIEVRSAGVNKGNAALHYAEIVRPDFILGIGDDHTDEDLFAALPANAFTVRVGLGQSAAQYNIRGIPEVLNLLRLLAASGKHEG